MSNFKSPAQTFARRLAVQLATTLHRLAARLERYSAVDTATAHVHATVTIAGWPADTADALIVAGGRPAEAARLFRDALARVQ